eukprot:GGOE01058761.1.p7 GENE.GGOE01058761.1~~GGOE01058761.1.p7  ORF type:complete len:123 (-),score=9.99 GGOE01058761.1:651-1019(-)
MLHGVFVASAIVWITRHVGVAMKLRGGQWVWWWSLSHRLIHSLFYPPEGLRLSTAFTAHCNFLSFPQFPQGPDRKPPTPGGCRSLPLLSPRCLPPWLGQALGEDGGGLHLRGRLSSPEVLPK